MAAVTGILSNVSLATEQTNIIEPYVREVFINETPLFSRLPIVQLAGNTYSIDTYDIRPRAYTIDGAITASSGDTDLILVDATPLQVGDVMNLLDTAGTSFERVEVTSVTNGTTVEVRRARESTSVLANTSGGSAASKVVTLIGNSRTGAEYNQVAHRMVRTLVAQYCQTFMFAVQVGGLANAVRNTQIPGRFPDVFTMEQEIAMTEMTVDIEMSSVYGKGEAPSAVGDRAKQKGLRYLISSGNVKTTGGASYTKLNFVADGPQKAIDGGGNPDVCICSTNFLTGLATWGATLQQSPNPRENAMGLPIEEYYVPFLGKPITFVPSYHLDAGTAILLDSRDVRMRSIRRMFWQRRGEVGDVHQGDFIGDYNIELAHPGWHAWVSGITSFA